MSYRRIIGLVLILMLVMASISLASLKRPGLNGAAFLKIGVGARMVALGSAATSIQGDPNALFWNPAGISVDAGRTQVGFTYNNWIADLGHHAGAVTHNFNNIGTFGIGFIYMGLSDITADRDIAPAEYSYAQIDQGSGTYNYNDVAFIVAYSKQFTDKFRMGAAAKYISESIDDQTASAYAFDFGAIYKTGLKDLTIGARLNNVGGDLKFYALGNPLPLNFSIGMNMTIAQEENTKFQGFFDFTKPQDSPQLYFVGGEWTLFEKFALRGGYKFNYSNIIDDYTRYRQTDEGFTLGGGMTLPMDKYHMWLDYSFTDFNVLNDTHRFTLRFEL
ncbi:PorV/PorQ family protein [candidate division KSB1 bacterium]|nr:PorV/PorQ family protein [candidate division KSB1 bacterium]